MINVPMGCTGGWPSRVPPWPASRETGSRFLYTCRSRVRKLTLAGEVCVGWDGVDRALAMRIDVDRAGCEPRVSKAWTKGEFRWGAVIGVGVGVRALGLIAVDLAF